MDQFLPEVPLTLNAVDSFPRKLRSTAPVLASRITPLDLDGTVGLLLEMVRGKARGYVCVANVHTTTLAVRDHHFRKVLDGAAAVVADGMPIVWRVRAAGFPQVRRVYGADLVEATCAAGISAGLRHGFFGGLESVAEAMVACLRERYPSIQIAGVWNPGAIKQGEESAPNLLKTINNCGCDVLWVGLGAPKQEIWMAQHQAHLHVPVMVGVGQAFDTIAGRTVRPPAWVGSHGLEWLYRLIHEPRRLWKRYVIYNSLFLWYLLLDAKEHTSGRDSIGRTL
jgi:N-acetylglucosaminyldiphosphoundecaprenol N-acetyl-beta-D-mannosaminyltransferase